MHQALSPGDVSTEARFHNELNKENSCSRFRDKSRQECAATSIPARIFEKLSHGWPSLRTIVDIRPWMDIPVVLHARARMCRAHWFKALSHGAKGFEKYHRATELRCKMSTTRNLPKGTPHNATPY
ncbi:hypothetical protein EVAR_95511_1 [Eumeta japonica]|uniref:Uncharacterized protein n=1 Tax=Eumeta variegata TaxID=151549 RepID=A0A4C1UJJ4_EUMVA|nr:hypothetical protein EVAR_95511_1 [Eumeta japonica]